MKLLILILMTLTLVACGKGSGSSGAGSSPSTPANPDLLAFSSKTPGIVSSDGSTPVTLNGTFGFVGGHSSTGRTVTSYSIMTAAGRECHVATQSVSQITCNLDPAYIGNDSNNGYEESTEAMTITRTLDDASTSVVSAGFIQWKKGVAFQFLDLANLAPAAQFSINTGHLAGMAAGFWNNVNTPITPYATFTIINSGIATGSLVLRFAQTGAVCFLPDMNAGDSTCGSFDAMANTWTGTLAPNATCTFKLHVACALPATGQGIGMPYGTYAQVTPQVLYNDNLGNNVAITQDIFALYSN